MAVGVVSLIASICVDGLLRPTPNDGSFGMYGFAYGLVIAPLAGIAAAVWMYLVMHRRAKRAEFATAPAHHEQ